MSDNEPEITRFLDAWSNGETDALGRLMPEVYGELEQVARRQLRREGPHPTLQPTELVHEAFLRLVERRRVQWANRHQFYGFSAHLMRLILVDRARRRCAARRGGGAALLDLDLAVQAAADWRDDQLLALDDALKDLQRFNPAGCQVVDMRFFGGLGYGEIARVTGVSKSTVRNRWLAAKLWLLTYLNRRVEWRGETLARFDDDP